MLRRRLGAALLVAVCTAGAGPVEWSVPDVPTVVMEPSLVGGFFSMPWPNEVRLGPDGLRDLDRLPGIGYRLGDDGTSMGPLLGPRAMRALGRSVEGFGTNSAVYFQLSAPVDPASVPDAVESLDPAAPVALVEVATGRRVPVVAAVAGPDRHRPANLLTLLPYPGHPLAPDSEYLALVSSRLRTSDGRPFLPAEMIDLLDGPPVRGADAPTWRELRRQRAAARRAVQRSTSWRDAELVGFTAFRTQDLRRDLDAIVAATAGTGAPALDLEVTQRCGDDPTSVAWLRGTIELPRWQQGEPPYLWSGGEIVIDRAGSAVSTGLVEVPVTVRVPCGDPPESGWPAVAFVNGTGAGASLRGRDRPPFDATGWVVASIPPSFGQGRDRLDGLPRWLATRLGIRTRDQQAGLLFYNLLNPPAARSNPIQQAADHLGLLDALGDLRLDRERFGGAGELRVDRRVLVAAGHSQGAQTLPLVAYARPALAGVVSSAGSGGQFHTVSHLAEQRRMVATLSGDIDALDALSPVVQLVQTLTEAGDGINYPSAMHYLNVAGAADTCVAFETARHFAGGIGLDVVNRQPPDTMLGARELDPSVADLPISGNADGATRVSVELSGGHFAAFDHTELIDGFLADLAARRTPTIGPFDDVGGANCTNTRWDAVTVSR